MNIPKIVGLEQEYAITRKGGTNLSAFELSCLLINTYARHAGLRKAECSIAWDYAHETPFVDIRGKLFSKRGGQIMMSTEENQLINTPLANGARLYTDHAHPEYSTPECRSAREALAHDKAGEKILQSAISMLAEEMPELTVNLYKNNVDGQGHSYGTHENYLMDAAAHARCLGDDQGAAVRTLIPFLVTRQIYSGSGKVGAESGGGGSGFQLAQRSDFMENLFGLETMYARPIVNTRAEHHADAERFRRLHLIIGDANLCEFAGFLKLGTTQIVLQMLEDDFIDEDLGLKDPVAAIRSISNDYRRPVELADGRRLAAVDIQRRFLDHAARSGTSGRASSIPEWEIILEYWSNVLDGLEQLRLSEDQHLEDDPCGLVKRLDWVLKLWVMNRRRRHGNLSWDHPALKIMDLQYHNIDRERGIFHRLAEQGLVLRLLSDAEINACVHRPPDDTRAYFRGTCLRRYPDEVYLVNWEVVGFDHGKVHRLVPLLNPLKGTRDRFETIFARCGNSRELIRELESVR